MTINYSSTSAPLKTIYSNIEFAVSRLSHFATLEEDWDSYGAPPIDGTVLEDAKRHLRWLSQSPLKLQLNGVEVFPAPSATGGVDLYFDLGDKTLLFAINPSNQASTFAYIQKKNGRSVVIREGSLDLDDSDRHYEWLNG